MNSTHSTVRRWRFVALLAIGASVPLARAQLGDKYDKPGMVQQEVVPRSEIPPSVALSPAEELLTFRLPADFRVELIASEPLVEDPVDLQFDEAGRLWIVEMRGFMNALDERGSEQPNGRIVVLSDLGRGRPPKRTVFADNLVMPRAVMPVGGGLLVGEPPQLWFMRDTDGDGKADSKVSVTDNFGVGNTYGVEKTFTANAMERMPNSPLWNIDNAIYFAEYTTRLRYTKGRFETEFSNFRGEWGLTQDDVGHLYYNFSEDPLRGDLIPTQYAGRNPHQPEARGISVQMVEDDGKQVWPVRVTPGVNRAYQPGILVNHRLRRFTAACSPIIYRGGLFGPDFDGNCIVCDPAANLVRRFKFNVHDGRPVATNYYRDSEFSPMGTAIP